MTVAEAIEAGWPADEAPAYVAAREAMAAKLAQSAQSSASVTKGSRDEIAAEEAAGTPGEFELRAHALAAQLLEQADAQHVAATAGKAAQTALSGARVAVVDRPGQEMTTEKQRALALAEARQRRPVFLRPGADNAVADYVLNLGGGKTLITRQAVPPVGRVILPGEWADHDRAEAERERHAENELLVSVFGAERCQRAGIVP